MDASDNNVLRLSVTLPGSASLGALQAGAMAALAETIGALRERGVGVRIDALGGASAGSIVALLFARGALLGSDVAALLRRAWVEEVDVDQLVAERPDAPLGVRRLADSLNEYLRDEPADGDPLVDDLGLHIGLSNLLGVAYPVATYGTASHALSFTDWAQFELSTDGGVEQFVEPVGRSPLDYCMASASHPGAFPPQALDRSEDEAGYLDNGVVNFPESGHYWFTDGGLVESKPVGRVVDYARRRAGPADGRRLHLVIDPRSSGPSGDARWSDPDTPVRWVDGLRRSVSVVPTQALHDDVRRVAEVNERLERVEELVRALSPHLDDAGRRALAQTLSDDDGRTADDDVDELLRAAVGRAAGVADKERIDLEMVSPLELTRDRDQGVSGLLAGDFVGAFGGFLDQRLRASDFALGWCSFVEWLPGGLDRHEVSSQTIEGVISHLHDHRFDITSDDIVDGGVSELTWTDRVRLGKLAGRLARILVGESVGLHGDGRRGRAPAGEAS